MQEWGQNIKKRREEQMRLIRQGMHKSSRQTEKEYSPNLTLFTTDTENPAWFPPPPLKNSVPDAVFPSQSQILKSGQKTKKKSWKYKILIQSVIAAGLFLGTTLIHQQPYASSMVKSVVTSIWEKDLNFVVVSNWYKQVVGNDPSILPVFSKQKEVAPTAIWKAPAKGKLLLPFTTDRNGIVIHLLQNDPVKAAADGWVSFVGKKEGLGETVIIQHKDGSETWYGFLEKLSVKQKAVVKQGDSIGKTATKKEQHFVYFAIKKNNKWIDPVGVVKIEG